MAGITAVSDSPQPGGTLRDAIVLVDTQGSPTTPNSIVFNIPISDPGHDSAD